MSNEPLCLSLYEKSASKLSIWAFSASRAWDLEIWVATGKRLTGKSRGTTNKK